MKIALSAESTIDLPKNLLREFNIKTIPFTLVMGEKAALDGEVLGEDLFAYTAKTGKLARTAAVNLAQFSDYFSRLLQQDDFVIHISLSSEISSAYQNAVTAAKEWPGKVFVIDSRSLSTGIALLALYARKLIDAGFGPEDVVKAVTARIPFDQASFALESVDYLYKGGRCNALAALGVNLLHIRPQIIVKDGKMIQGKKFHGPMVKWVGDYVDETLREFSNPDLEVVFITFSSATDEVVEVARARLRARGFKRIIPTRAGGTICCHCGPHCLGVLYLNDGAHPVINGK